MGWKIWDYDKNTKTIRLISSRPTNATLALTYATGYNNGVWAINEICRQCYGQYDESGKTRKGISIANLRRSDIQKVWEYDYTQYKHLETDWHENENGTIRFGNSKTYSNPKYPKIWEQCDSKWLYERKDDGTEEGSDKECLIWEEEYGFTTETGIIESSEATSPTFKQSYYHHITTEDEFANKKYYDLLFKNENGTDFSNVVYWLSSRCVDLLNATCTFEINLVHDSKDDCGVMGGGIYSIYGDKFTRARSLRPIVSINLISSGYSLEKQTDEAGNIVFNLKKE